MGSKSDYLELEILDHILGGGDYTRPATVYLRLYTVTPTDAGGGTEVTGGSYTPLSITNNNTNFPAASGGAKTNGVDFTFVTATANWGTIVAWALWDASSGGNMLYWGDVTPNKAINNGDTAKFTAGDLDITED